MAGSRTQLNERGPTPVFSDLCVCESRTPRQCISPVEWQTVVTEDGEGARSERGALLSIRFWSSLGLSAL